MEVLYNPFNPKFYDNPRPIYRRLRDEAPAYWSEPANLWALSRYEDVKAALLNWRVFSSEAGHGSSGPAGELFKEYPHLLMFDPPRHSDLRRVLSGLLTPQRMHDLKDAVRELVCNLLDPFVGEKGFDLTDDFAGHLPPLVIADLLGIPRADAPLLMRAVDKLADYSNPNIMQATLEAVHELRDYYADYFRERRKRPAGDDIVWHLLEAVRAGVLAENEALGFAILVTIAGGETTIKMITNLALLLYRNPDQRALLVAEPELTRNTVEEGLRYAGSTHMLTRTLTEDVELHGQTMRKGDTVALIFSAANQDERKFADPDRFDIRRKLRGDHLAFGGGVHACLGAPLARLELTVAFEEMLKRWPQFEIDETGLERHMNPYVTGYRKMPMRFG